MRNILVILFAFFVILSCKKEEIHTYKGRNYVQFESTAIDRSYSFVHYGSSIKRDTIWVSAFCTGGPSKDLRYFDVMQVPEYTFEARYDDNDEFIDSILVRQPNQAIPDVHYVDFNSDDYKDIFQVKADSVYFKVPVIVIRDLSLKTQNKTLLLEFKNSRDFEIGDPKTKTAKIILSDMIIFPEAWSFYTTNPSNIGKNPILGQYGKVKHQLLIDITGKPWDNDFIDSLTYEELLFYKHKASKELNIINEKRASMGEGPLLEDPNNPNSVVEFP